MKLIDLHCDTALRLYHEKQSLYENSCHVSLKKAQYLEAYAQVMAVWIPKRISDGEGYAMFFDCVKNLKNEISLNADKAGFAEKADEMDSLLSLNKRALLLSVEDARILENDLSRLDGLRIQGVRLLTLNWSGVTCIGGAHDTDVGLSDFGEDVVRRCFEIGIIPDVSHSSFSGASRVIDIAKEYNKPIVASHSDSYAVNPHSRNLKDADFTNIAKLGGIVGINLCPAHLSSSGSAEICDVLRHIEHYLSLGGEDALAMGSDLDGTDLPQGFNGIEHLYKIFDEMQKRNYSEELIEKIAFGNAHRFFKNNL